MRRTREVAVWQCQCHVLCHASGKVITSTPPKSVEYPPAFLFQPDQGKAFYSWDGKLIRPYQGSAAASASPDGRFYASIGNKIQIWKRNGTPTGTIANIANSWIPWARDGNVLCGATDSGVATSVLFMLDVNGQIHRTDAAISVQFGVQACSMGTRRASVLVGQEYFAILSLDDGRELSEVPLRWQSSGYLFSPDALWLAEPARLADGVSDGTDVIDLSDGTIKTELKGLRAFDFTPDSRYLLMNDLKMNQIRMIDWRTGQEAWSTTGYLASMLSSDRATDKMLLQVWRDGPKGQTNTFLIVSTSANVTQFFPATP